MTKCSLLNHLETTKRLAELSLLTAEVRRLELEIAKHRDKCVTCAGVESVSLLNHFFNMPVVIVNEEEE